MNSSDQVQIAVETAKQLCYNNTAEKLLPNNFCERVFDGMLCWPRTSAGVLAVQSCSGTLIKATKKGLASKKCEENGEWYMGENCTSHWTNYTECGTFFIELNSSNSTIDPLLNSDFYSKWVPIIKTITHVGYVFSLVCLILAIIVFIKIKRLHCSRNKLHIHLFASFALRAAMSLLKDAVFVKGTALMHEVSYVGNEPIFSKENYSWICKAIITIRNYFIISNHTFMLMEGTYLHNLMFLNLFSENGVLIYYAAGWGLPLPFSILWIILKFNYDNVLCWTQKGSTLIYLLIELPIGLSVTANFILFTIVVRVLFIKLTSMYIQQRKVKYRKLMRSTLILVPLFGIPYFISLILRFYISHSKVVEIFWLFFDQTFTAFQGFFASLVYCLLNSEVQTELLRKYSSFKDRNNKEFKRSRTISHTQQVSLPLTEEIPEIVLHHVKKEEVTLKTSEYF